MAVGQQHHSTACKPGGNVQKGCVTLSGLDKLLPEALDGSSLASAGRQTVVERIAERLGGLQDLRAARGERLLRPLPEQLQPGLPAHLGDAGSPSLPPADPRLGRDGQAARVARWPGGGAAGLHALKGCTVGRETFEVVYFVLCNSLR